MRAKGFFITGTDTGVGKTVVTACLASLFGKYQIDVGVMKPLETGVGCGEIESSDAGFLAQTAGVTDALSDISPYRFKAAASPYQAARLENRLIDTGKIVEAFHRLAKKHEAMLVEGIGGLLAPITRDYQVIGLARDLGLPLIVVSRVTVGTINHTLMTLNTAKAHGVEVYGVIFNHLEESEKNPIEGGNPEIIRELSDVRVLGEFPFIKNVSTKSFTPELLLGIEKNIDFDFLRKM